MNERKILLGIGIGTLVVSAALGYGIYYSMGEIGEKESAIQTKRDEIAAAQKKIAEIKAIEDKVIVLRESVSSLASVLPTQKEMEEFVTQIAVSKGETGVHMRELTLKPAAGGKQTLGKVFEKISYGIELRGSIWQFLEFLHRLESFKRFVMIPNIKISPGQREKGLSDVLHTYRLDVETFTYNPGKSASTESIASYEVRAKNLREEIDRSIYTIEQPPVEFSGQRGRRDVFVDPRAKSGGKDEGVPIEQQREIVEKLRARVDEFAALVTKLKSSQSFIERFEVRAQLDEKAPALEVDIEKACKEATVTDTFLVRTLQNEVKDAFQKAKKAGGAAPAEDGPSVAELTNLVAKIREILQSGRLREAIDAAKPILDRAAAIEKDPARKPLIDELRRIDADARIAERFEKKKLNIGGIVLYENRKAALINGRALEPGDALDEDLVVADIQEDGVTFVLENVQITKKW
jgi:Tfp pilus assembly protein PilO